jgi:adenylate cyclase
MAGGLTMRTLLVSWLDKLGRAGLLPDDSDEECLCKTILTYSSSLIIVLAIFWVVVYSILGLWLSAAIPLAYQLISIATLLRFARTKEYVTFRFLQLLMMLILPVLLQLSLGGYVASSAVILWSLTAPLGALLFHGARQSVPWFIAFLVLVAASGAVDGFVARYAAPIPTPLMVLFFVMNLAGVSTTVYLLTQYFARRREEALAALRIEQARSERLLLNVLPPSIAQR